LESGARAPEVLRPNAPGCRGQPGTSMRTEEAFKASGSASRIIVAKAILGVRGCMLRIRSPLTPCAASRTVRCWSIVTSFENSTANIEKVQIRKCFIGHESL